MAKGGDKAPVQDQAAFSAVLQSQTAGRIVVPGGDFLQNAEFVRSGPDLVLVGADGTRILIKDFFASESPPDLISDSGAVIDAALATTMAGPMAPGQYAQTSGGSALATIGKVSVANGKVTVKHADGTKSELHKGDAIFKDDVIDTDKGGAVGITFDDGTTFSLGSAGRMVLDDMVYDPATKTGSGNIALIKGAFTFVSGQIPKTHPDAMTVKTPVMTVGIRGTAGAGNTETIVLMAERGGVAGELVITTPSGQSLTINVPGLAASIAPGGSLVSVQMSPAQINQLAGNSLGALPNPGSLSNSYNSNGNQPNDQPLQPPPSPQQQQQLNQTIQNAVEQALALQQSVKEGAQANQQIAQLAAQTAAQVAQARNDAKQAATEQLNQQDTAHQARIEAAIAAVRAIRDQINPLSSAAQNALITAEAAFSQTDSAAVQDAVDAQLLIAQTKWNAIGVDDTDAAVGIQTLLDRALAATQGVEGGQTVTYSQAVAVYNSEILTLKSAAYAAYTRIETLSRFTTLAKTWTDGSAISAKMHTKDAAKAAAEAVSGRVKEDGSIEGGLQKAANDAATAETLARQNARSPVIEAAAAKAEWDVQIASLAEVRASLGKAVTDYVTTHQGLSGADTTYGLTADVLAKYAIYKGLIDAKPGTTSATDYHLQADVKGALADLVTAMDGAGLDTNIYSQAISAWMTAEASSVTAEATANAAYTDAHALELKALALVDAAQTAASDAAVAYAAGQAAATAAADAAATARYEEVLAATSAQYQADQMMTKALDELAGDLGSDSSNALHSAKGDVAVAKAAALAAKAAALSAASFNVANAHTAVNAAQAAVDDFTARETEAATAVGNAKSALAMASKRPDGDLLTQAENASKDLANQAQQKAEADYAKALTIQADIANQKALAQAYLAEAQQAYGTAQAYQAAVDAQNASTVAAAQSAADAAATQAKAAWDAAQSAKTSADTTARLLNKTVDSGESRDVAKDLDDRIRADTDGTGPITEGSAITALGSMRTSLTTASGTYDAFKAAAATLGNATVTAKLAAAMTALAAANATSGAVKAADDAITSARLQLADASAGTKQADIATALNNAKAQSDIAAAAAEHAHSILTTDASAVTAARAEAQVAANAAKLAAGYAATATDLSKQLAADVQALASLQTSVDTKVADASAKVKAAVEAVNWANADYLAVSLSQTARTAIDSAANSSDAVDTQAFINTLKSTITANTASVKGTYTQLAAMKTAALASTADLQARATIENAFARADSALSVINNAISKIEGNGGLLAKAQAALSTAETKTTEALAATTASEAIAAATQAQNAATEAKRLADLIADYRLQVSNPSAAVDSAAEIIQAAYAEAVSAQARLSTATSMKSLLDTASLSLTQAQTAASEVVKQTNLAQSNAKVASDAISDVTKTYLDIDGNRTGAHTAAGLAASNNTTVASKTADAISNANKVIADYEKLDSSQKTTVLTAYYDQAKKIVADAGALTTDSADRAAAAAKAETVADNAYNTLFQYAANVEAREVAAVDAAAATAQTAMTALTNAASRAATTYSQAQLLDASVNTTALANSISAFLTAHPRVNNAAVYDAVDAIRINLGTANGARSAATGKLTQLDGTITADKGTATTAYDVVKALDALSNPTSSKDAPATDQVGLAITKSQDIQAASVKVTDMAAAMDAQKGALSKAIDQIAALQTQFQSYVDTLSAQAKVDMKVDAVNDALAFNENAGLQTIDLVGNDVKGTGGALKVTVLSLPTKGTLYLEDGLTKVTTGQELTEAQATTLKYAPSGALQSPGAIGAAFTDGFSYQLTRSGTVETLVNGTLTNQAYSTTDSASVTLTITHVNYAPTLQGSNPTLPTIAENVTNSDGILVKTLLAGYAKDTETASANMGMAVTGLSDATGGTWEYKLGSGSWTTVPAVSNGGALLLGPNDSLRFKPNANWNSQSGGATPTVTFRAWDGSAGTAGGTVDTSTNGGFSAYSTATLTAGITVTAVVLVPTLSVSAAELYSATVTDIALGINVANIPDATSIQITGLPTGATLSVGTPVNGVYTLTREQLSGLTLRPADGYNGDITLKIKAIATDGSGANLVSKTDSIDLKIGVGAQNVAVDGVSDRSGSNRAVIMQGGNNADTMTGSAQADSLSGGGGADTLTGGGGADTLTGGTGADVFRFTSASQSVAGAMDVITDFTSGSDAIKLDGVSGMNQLRGAFTWAGSVPGTVTAITGTAGLTNTVVFFTDTTDGYLYVKGGSFDGTLIKLAGMTAAPALGDLVGITNELLVGTAGSDTLIGGSGTDTLVGGDGADSFRFLAASDSTAPNPDVIADFVSGTDTIDLQGIGGIALMRGSYGYAGSVAGTVASIVGNSQIAKATVFFTDGSHGYLYVKGAGTGTSFDGTLIVLAGRTTPPAMADLTGLTTELIVGTGGADTMIGGSGTDILTGGAGNDAFVFQAASDSTAPNPDIITDFTSGSDVIVFQGMGGVPLLRGAYAYAGTVADTVSAIVGDTRIGAATVFFTDGTHGYVYVKGSAGGTSFDGTLIVLANRTAALTEADLPGLAAELVLGTSGADTLIGGLGGDTLTGGLGADVFKYESKADSLAASPDVITDFTTGSDSIRFQGIGGVAMLNQAFAYDTSVSTTISNIVANGDITNATVYFTDGTDGYLYVKGTGTGANFDGTLIKLAGVTAAPSMADLAGITTQLVVGTSAGDTLDATTAQEILVGGAGSDLFRFGSASASSAAATDTIRDLAPGNDYLSLQGANGYRQLHGSFTWAGSTSATIAAINADAGIADSLVFFTDGTQGWVYAKGAGTGGTSYDGLLVNLTGITTTPGPIFFGMSEYLQSTATAITTSEDSAGTGTAAVRFGGAETFTYDFGRDGSNTPITSIPTAKGVATIDTATGIYTYTPGAAAQALAAGQTDTDSFIVHAHTANGVSSTATVAVTLNGVNDAPVLKSGSAAANADGGGAVSFDGAGDTVNTTLTSPNLATGDFTLEAWIKTTGASEGILAKSNGDNGWGGGEKNFYIDATGCPRFVGFSNGYIYSGTPVNDGQWHHVAVVWDYSGSGTTGVGKIYVDGVETTTSSSYAANAVDNVGDTLAIGKGNNYSEEAANDFSGLIENVRIWDVARTGPEISGAMSTPLAANTAGLVAEFRLNEQTGSTVTSTNGLYTGTLAGEAHLVAGAGETVQTQQVVAEDSAGGAGDFVSSLSNLGTDVDNGALKGIAVVGTNSASGVWQYSTDNGTTWTSFGTVSESQALLLLPTDKIRFVPAQDWTGNSPLVWRAWDQSDGAVHATKVAIGATGGTSAFSAATGTHTIEVTPVNDAPVVTLPTTTASFTEDGAAAAPFATATLSDVDNPTLAGATIAITAPAAGDVLAFINQNGITGSYNAGTGVLTLTGTATQADYQAAIRSVTYFNPQDSLASGSRSVTLTINDGAASSGTVTSTIAVTGVNDGPVVQYTPASALHFDGVDDSIDIPHTGATAFAGSEDFTIAMWVRPETGGTLFRQNANSNELAIYTRLDADGSLQLNFDAAYAGGWESVHTNAGVMSFNEWHQLTLVKSGATITVYVDGVGIPLSNDALTGPRLSVGEGNDGTHFGTNGGSDNFRGDLAQLALFDGALTQQAIRAWNAGGADVLDPASAALLKANYQFSAGSGTVVADLTGLNGNITWVGDTQTAPTWTQPLTVAEDHSLHGRIWAADLDGGGVIFPQSTNTPHGTATVSADGHWVYTPAANYVGTDTLTIGVDDGQGGSTYHSITINVAEVPDAPVIGATGAALAYSAGAGPVSALPDGLTLTDVDSNAFRSVTINLTGGGAGDVLDLNPVSGSSFGLDHAFYYDDGSGWGTHNSTITVANNQIVVTFAAGSPASATVIRDILRSVEFSSDSFQAGARTLQISVTDTSETVGTASRAIDYNAAPEISVSGGNINMGLDFVDLQSYAATAAPVTTQVDSFTVEMRFNWQGDDIAHEQVLFYNGNSSSNGFGLTIADGKLNVLLGGVSYNDTGVAVTAGEWHHVALVRDTGNWHVYLDGADTGFALSTTPNTIADGNTTIGNASNLASGFVGQIDDVMVWSEVRSLPQVQADANGNAIAPTANLRAWWRGDMMAGGTVVTDSSSYANHITLDAVHGPQPDFLGLDVLEDSPTPITLTVSDDHDAIGAVTRTLVSNGAHGTVTITGDTYTYTPNANFFGEDSFVIRATDSQGASADYVIDVHVKGVNDTPTSTAFGTREFTIGTAVTIDVRSHFTDVDAGDVLTYTFSNKPAWLTWDATAGTLSGTPPAGATATDIIITATDLANMSTSQTVRVQQPEIIVTGVNQPGSALVFDGIDDMATATVDLAASAATVEMWVQMPNWQSASDQLLFGNGVDMASDDFIALSVGSGGALTLRYGGSSQAGHQTLNIGTAGLQDGSWHHVAFSWEPDNSQTRLTLYLDGTPVQTSTTALNISNITHLDEWFIGSTPPDGSHSLSAFTGAVDNVRLWGDARTPSEILSNMPLKAAGSADNLLADWRMDAVTAQGVADANSGPTLALGSDVDTDSLDPLRLNPPGHAMDLTGGYITLQNPAITTSMTFEAWVRPDSLGGTMNNFTPLFSTGMAGQAGYLAIGYNDSGALIVDYRDANLNPGAAMQTTGHLAADMWNHVAVVITPQAGGASSSITLYQNGEQVGMVGSQPLLTAGLRDNAYIGNAMGGMNPTFNGDIADVRLYETARTTADITTDMNTRLGGDEYGLVMALALDNSYTVNGLTVTSVNNDDDKGTFTGAVINGGASVISTKPASFAESITTREDTPATTIMLAHDVYGHPLTYSVAGDGQPAHGWLNVQQDGRITYRPDDNYVGSDSFKLSITDNMGNTVTKTIPVTVSAVDDPVSAHAPTSTEHSALGLYGDTAVAIAGGLATGTSAVTYEAWVRVEGNTGGDQVILSAGGGGADSLALTLNSGLLRMNLSGHQVSASNGMTAGVWHHVAAVVETGANALTNLSLYVDGKFSGQDSFAGGYNLNGTTAWLGRGLNDGAGFEGYLSGELSDVRVYTEARSMANIQADMAGGAGNASLIAQWATDEVSGTTVNDSSAGGSHDGTITGSHFEWDNRVIAVTTAGTATQIGGLTLYDPDAIDNIPATLKLTITAGHGIVHLDPANLTGVTFVNGTANDSATLSFTGSLAALTTALSTATYTPTNGFSGRDGVTFTIDENALTIEEMNALTVDERNALTTRADGGTLSVLVLAAPTAFADTLSGSAGNDVIDGLAGNDVIDGLRGDDTLLGGAGDDRLYGGAGNDTLTGGAGQDTLLGNDGADVFRYTATSDSTESSPDNILDFGGPNGADVIRFEGMAGISYDPNASLMTLGLGSPTTVADAVAAIKGSALSNVMVFFNVGNGYLYVKGAGTGATSFDGTLIQLTGRFSAPMAEEILNGAIYGTPASDVLVGTAAGDVIFGNLGNDSLDGAGGADTLIGGDGVDTLTGGTGADVFRFGGQMESNWSSPDIITDFTAANGDRIQVTGMDGIAYTGIPYANVQATVSQTITAIQNDMAIQNQVVFFTQDGDGYLLVRGTGTGNPMVDGMMIKLSGVTTAPPRSAIDNVLSMAGTSANDILNGTSADDIIDGAMGYDTINGGAGNDTLSGGQGADTLTGGTGNDVFRFTSGTDSNWSMPDTITDFTAGQDHLSFAGISGISYDSSPYQAVGVMLSQTIDTIRMDQGITNRAVFFVQNGDGYVFIKSGTGAFNDTLVKLAGVTAAPSLADLSGLVATSGITVTNSMAGTLTGTAQNDTLNGNGSTNQALYGLDGNDTISGGMNSFVLGGKGADTLSGGMGTNFIYTSKLDSNLTDGVDAITFTDAAAQRVVFSGMAGISAATAPYNIGGMTTVSQVVDAIAADTNVVDKLVFFSLGGDGYLTVKGVGTGTDFSGTVIKLTGHTSPLGNFDLSGVMAPAITGTSANESYIGSMFGEIMRGMGGDDLLNGDGGDDTLVGGTGADNLVGASGNDTFLYEVANESTLSSTDTISDFTVASDRIKFQGMTGMWYSGGTYPVDGATNPADAVAMIIGDHNITNEVVFFQLFGSGYLYVKGAGTGVNFDGSLIRLASVGTAPPVTDIQVGNMYGTMGNDVLTGTAGGELIDGGMGDDIVHGGGGNDILYGSAGNDTLYGDDGNDTLFGGSGMNVLSGGAGNDTYITGEGTDTIISGGGSDTVTFIHPVTNILRSGDDLVFHSSGGITVISNQFAGQGVSSVQMSMSGMGDYPGRYSVLAGQNGDNFSNLLGGTVGADTMLAGNGDDIVMGDSGNDLLIGGSGMDALRGDNGNDTLIGGFEGDLLTGGMDMDTFRFLSAADSNLQAWDVISDFTVGQDKLDLAGLQGLPGLSLVTTNVDPQASVQWVTDSIIQNPGIPDNSIVFWRPSFNTGYVYVKASGSPQNGLLIELADLTTDLTASDFVQLAAPAAGTALAWDGGGAGDLSWTNAANWADDVTPDATRDVLLSGSNVALSTAATATAHSITASSTSLTLSNGTLALADASLMDANSVLSVSGSGLLAGTGKLSLAGSLYWTGGSLTNTEGVFVSGDTSITGTATRTLNTVLALGGETTLANATISGTGELANGGFLTTTNSATANVGIANDGVLSVKTSSSATNVTLTANATVMNSGIIELDARAGTGDVAALTLGQGSALFIAQDGILRADDDGNAVHTVTGNVILGGGAIQALGNLTLNNQNSAVVLEGGTITVAHGHALTIDGGTGGKIEFDTSRAFTLDGSGSLNLAGTQTVSLVNEFNLTEGVKLNLTGAVTFEGAAFANNTNLVLQGANDVFNTMVHNNGELSILGDSASGNALLTFNGGLSNAVLSTLNLGLAAGSLSNATIEMGSSTLNNAGTFNVFNAGTGNLSVHGAIDNSGEMHVNANLSVTNSGMAITNSGTLDIETGRTLAVNVSGGLTNQATGIVTGSGTIVGNVANSGTLAAGSNEFDGMTLSISGNLTATNTSTIDIDVNAALNGSNATIAEADKLVVNGNATLAGKLSFNFHGYVPTDGQMFTVLTANSLDASGLAGANGIFHDPDDIMHNLGAGWTANWAVVGNDLQVTFNTANTVGITGSWTNGMSTINSSTLVTTSPVTVTDSVDTATLRAEANIDIIGAAASIRVVNNGLITAGNTLNIWQGALIGEGDVLDAGNLSFLSGSLAGTGTLRVEGTATLGNTGTLIVDKRLALAGTSTLSGYINGTNAANSNSVGRIENYGTMTINTMLASVQIAMVNEDGGTMTWDAGYASGQGNHMSLDLGNAFNNFINEGTLTLTGGTGDHGVEIKLNGSRFDNAGVMILADNTTQVDSVTGSLANFGSLTIGHDLIVHGMLSSSGVIDLHGGNDTTLTLDSTGSTLENLNLLIGSGVINDNGNAAFNNSGTISPGGDQAGTITVTDDLTLEQTSLLKLDVGDGGTDLLSVGGHLTLNGQLEVVINGDVTAGTTYTPLTFGSANGNFDGIINLDDPLGTMLLDPFMSATSLTLTARNVTQTATAGDDVVTGSNAADYLCLGSGDDTVHAGAGADAIFAQSGDDTIGITGTDFHMLDGGSGFDFLAWEGAAGTTLDLTTISGMLQNIEAVTLEADGAQTLRLDGQTIAAMLGGAINSATGTANTLVVIGQGDTLELNNGIWSETQANVHLADDPGTSYTIYNDANSGAQVYVSSSTTVTMGGMGE